MPEYLSNICHHKCRNINIDLCQDKCQDKCQDICMSPFCQTVGVRSVSHEVKWIVASCAEGTGRLTIHGQWGEWTNVKKAKNKASESSEPKENLVNQNQKEAKHAPSHYLVVVCRSVWPRSLKFWSLSSRMDPLWTLTLYQAPEFGALHIPLPSYTKFPNAAMGVRKEYMVWKCLKWFSLYNTPLCPWQLSVPKKGPQLFSNVSGARWRLQRLRWSRSRTQSSPNMSAKSIISTRLEK